MMTLDMYAIVERSTHVEEHVDYEFDLRGTMYLPTMNIGFEIGITQQETMGSSNAPTQLHSPALMESTDRKSRIDSTHTNDVANDQLDESDSDSPLDHDGTDDEQSSSDDGHSFEDVTARDNISKEAEMNNEMSADNSRLLLEEIPDVIVEDPDAMEKDMMSNTCPPEDLQQQKQQLKGDNNKVEYNQLKENVMNSMSNNCIPRSNSVHNQCSPNKALLEIVTHQVASQELEESKKDLQQYEDEESSTEPLKQAAKEVDLSPRATTKWGKKGKHRVSTTREDFIKEECHLI
ncbi:hypothetical protein K7X08_007138 [Anisodus acutangulus]|uniref:Uncharacterized protein n=1 Tax=Anisodus acutangulus TaxID=402998 RepID=A0A9Q1LC35_9SOLA|nr:hypothetical protein K7X08_007138 [Anisodus acutangulus]